MSRCMCQAVRPAGRTRVCLPEGGVSRAPASREPEILVNSKRSASSVDSPATATHAAAWDQRAPSPALLTAQFWLPVKCVSLSRCCRLEAICCPRNPFLLCCPPSYRTNTLDVLSFFSCPSCSPLFVCVQSVYLLHFLKCY